MNRSSKQAFNDSASDVSIAIDCTLDGATHGAIIIATANGISVRAVAFMLGFEFLYVGCSWHMHMELRAWQHCGHLGSTAALALGGPARVTRARGALNKIIEPDTLMFGFVLESGQRIAMPAAAGEPAGCWLGCLAQAGPVSRVQLN